jgi:GntR family transcriptional repressor for pyruvate dehydrogenase complex
MNEKRRSVIEKILGEIRSGDLAADGKLPSERDFSKLLAENRTVVREALISLEAMGVVEIRERQGIFVSSGSANEAKEQFLKSRQWPADMVSRALEMRQMIDPTAAGISAMRRSESDVSKLESCLDNMRGLIHDPSDEASKTGAYWNTIYHSIIVSSTGNTYLTRIYEGLLAGIEYAMNLMRAGTEPYSAGGRILAFDEHKKLFEALKAKDRDEAEKIAEYHLAHTVNAMIRLGLWAPG